MSPGRAYRLWRAAGLQVPRKRRRKRLSAARPRQQAPSGQNQVWSYDFVFDHCANGQQAQLKFDHVGKSTNGLGEGYWYS
jgi:putative transposase